MVWAAKDCKDFGKDLVADSVDVACVPVLRPTW